MGKLQMFICEMVSFQRLYLFLSFEMNQWIQRLQHNHQIRSRQCNRLLIDNWLVCRLSNRSNGGLQHAFEKCKANLEPMSASVVKPSTWTAVLWGEPNFESKISRNPCDFWWLMPHEGLFNIHWVQALGALWCGVYVCFSDFLLIKTGPECNLPAAFQSLSYWIHCLWRSRVSDAIAICRMVFYGSVCILWKWNRVS